MHGYLCTNTQTRRGWGGRGREITRARKWHLNSGGMLHKISRTFFGEPITAAKLIQAVNPRRATVPHCILAASRAAQKRPFDPLAHSSVT